MSKPKWEPLNPEKLQEIEDLFYSVYPEKDYGPLAGDISRFWIALLKESWEKKDPALKELDEACDPGDPLSRVSQKTTVITYADSVKRKDEATLKTLDVFLSEWFPHLGGLHILPACTVVEDRFNDGYFSQVVRDSIHPAFGSNELFSDLVHRYFSMNDLVMGHVDIENPAFQAYLAGDDGAGKTFFTFTEKEYQELKSQGSFDKVFRPRPFPLFTLFRRQPRTEPHRSRSAEARLQALGDLIQKETGIVLEPPVLGILSLFAKIKNDQMLLREDADIITFFREWLADRGINEEPLFTVSVTQEVQHTPYIFTPAVADRGSLLALAGFGPGESEAAEALFDARHEEFLGQEIRALTTFSHVQVDVNTTTLEGLQRFGRDLVWYLTKDLNMLRLDAVNYAFKKWGTSCFGLPELDRLMKIVYLSLDCISPRMIPNLEVNDSLTTILKTMASETAAPPMMHDFHLASLLPALFHTQDPSILARIPRKIAEFRVPRSSIRFSLSESHDGKSVRGSMDLLHFAERRVLTEAVKANGGFVKYKSIPPRLCTGDDWKKYCREEGLDPTALGSLLFEGPDDDESLRFRREVQSLQDIFRLEPRLNHPERIATAEFFFSRILEGRDPYELCISTRDALPKIDGMGTALEADRFLAFQTLALAVMGRNVKTVYFNDLLGLPNDYGRVKQSGELRDIKRTRVDYDALLPQLRDPDSFTGRVARGMNELIGLADSEPSLHFRGEEAQIIEPGDNVPVAAVENRCGDAVSRILVNLSGEPQRITLPLPAGTGALNDRISGGRLTAGLDGNGGLTLELAPYGRLWLV